MPVLFITVELWSDPLTVNVDELLTEVDDKDPLTVKVPALIVVVPV